MVLASARPDISIEELDQMADKVIEVAKPSVSAVTTIPPYINAEMEQLRSEVAHLTNLVKSLAQRRHSTSPNRHRR